MKNERIAPKPGRLREHSVTGSIRPGSDGDETASMTVADMLLDAYFANPGPGILQRWQSLPSRELREHRITTTTRY